MGDSPKIVKLPEMVIWLICEQLSYEDLRNLRVTCKRLKEIADQRPFLSLHLFVDGYPFEQELFHSDELIGYASSWRVSNLAILKSTKFQSQFSKLRKLTIYYNRRYGKYGSTKEEYLDLNDLNGFQELEHLQIDCYHYLSITENSKLSLRNLRIALITGNSEESGESANFKLDCPRLEALGLGNGGLQPQLTPETSKSIRHLFVSVITNECETYMMILYGKLKNLSTISFGSDSDLNSFVLALMEGRVRLPSLKKINMDKVGCFSNRGVLLKNLVKLQSRYDTRYYEVLMNWKVISSDHLIELLNLLDKLIPPKDPEDPEYLERIDDSFFWQILDTPSEHDLLRHFAKNPILHWLFPGVKDVKFWSDESVGLGKQLIGKLRNLEYLTFGQEVALDGQSFECILKTCPGLCSLEIGCAGLDQRQLDLMPNYLRGLRTLRLLDGFSPGNGKSLDFVAKFKNLSWLKLYFKIEKETMSFILKNCNPGAQFELMFSLTLDIFINIIRKEKGWFKIKQANCAIRISEEEVLVKKAKFDSMEDAIDYYYRNDRFNNPQVKNLDKHWVRCCLM